MAKPMTRRTFTRIAAAATVGLAKPASAAAAFALRQMLPSCMYGYTSLAEILPEVKKIGATTIDVWPKVHGDQREQIARMGEEKFRELLDQNDVRLGCITQFKLGPFGLEEEFSLAKRFGCKLIVTGAKGPRGLKGGDLKAGIAEFLKQMKPHLQLAEANGVTVAIENHGNNLLESPDSLKWLADLRQTESIAIALAPYHLPQQEAVLARLIKELGPAIRLFYAWQHGMGCHKKLPKEQELLQMPGRGELDFRPLLQALREIDYTGWTEIFMHPVPRGIPILDTTSQVTAEINRARSYLQECLKTRA